MMSKEKMIHLVLDSSSHRVPQSLIHRLKLQKTFDQVGLAFAALAPKVPVDDRLLIWGYARYQSNLEPETGV